MLHTIHTTYEDGQWCSGQWNDERWASKQNVDHSANALANNCFLNIYWHGKINTSLIVCSWHQIISSLQHASHILYGVTRCSRSTRWRKRQYLFLLLCFHHSVNQRRWQEVEWQCTGRWQWWCTSADSGPSQLYLDELLKGLSKT